MSTPCENLVLLTNPAAVDALRTLFTSYETGLLRGDMFAARLAEAGWTATSESERLLRSDRFTFSALCTALKRGVSNLPSSFGAPSILSVHLLQQASHNDTPALNVPGARGNLRRDLIDTGATFLLRPFACAESLADRLPVFERNKLRESVRAILTRVEVGSLPPSKGFAELDAIGFSPAAIPDLARALSGYATSGRMDFSRALSAIDTFVIHQQEEREGGLSSSGLHTRIARTPAKTSPTAALRMEN